MAGGKRKIMLFMAKVDMGGIENLYLNVIPILRDEFDFLITYYGDGENELGKQFEELGCRIHKLNCNRYRHPLRFIRLIREFIRDNDIEVIHTNVGYSTFYGLIAAYLENTAVRIAHSHNSEFGNNENPVNRLFEIICKVTCHFLATTRINIGPLSARGLFLRGDESVYVPNGIDLERFKFNLEARMGVRRMLGIQEDNPVLLCVGRLAPVKNHDFLIDVFCAFKKKRENAWLLIVGGGSLEAEIRKKAESSGVAGCVHMAGAVPNPQDYCSAADALVMPSLHEGLSLAMIEAQKNGLVCFTSTNVDRASKVTENLSFLSLDEGPDVWADAIDNGIDGRQTIVEDERLDIYDMRNTAAILKQIYLGEAL